MWVVNAVTDTVLFELFHRSVVDLSFLASDEGPAGDGEKITAGNQLSIVYLVSDLCAVLSSWPLLNRGW